ncbi:MAG: transcription elongation factor GreA [Lachnospiraceae bacterium]|nr:transcription elongation factor GreA [Lachnospiraceae bacterium]MBR6274605.1 transcription elongation factor GreA [Lachnospiraceae bacterium]
MAKQQQPTIVKNVITREGLKRLEDELSDLKVNQRREIAEKIKEAREHGDLSENAEYDAARDEQRRIEARIEELEETLKNVEIVDEEDIKGDVVSVGCTVTITNTADKKQYTYKLVGTSEANFLKQKISNESPLGSALLGKKVNQKVVVKAPAGDVTYKINKIETAN